MSDKIFFIDIEDQKDWRYDMSKFMRFTDNADPITSKFMEDLKNLNPSGEYRIVGNEFRPDRISMAIYGHFQYWWIIMLYNNKIKLDELTVGTVLTYPNIEELEDIYFSLNSQEVSQ